MHSFQIQCAKSMDSRSISNDSSLQDIINLFINFIQSLIIHSSSKVLHVNQVHIDSTYYKTRFIPSFHSQFQVQILFQIQLFKAIFKNQLIILHSNFMRSLQDYKMTFEYLSPHHYHSISFWYKTYIQSIVQDQRMYNC